MIPLRLLARYRRRVPDGWCISGSRRKKMGGMGRFHFFFAGTIRRKMLLLADPQLVMMVGLFQKFLKWTGAIWWWRRWREAPIFLWFLLRNHLPYAISMVVFYIIHFYVRAYFLVLLSFLLMGCWCCEVGGQQWWNNLTLSGGESLFGRPRGTLLSTIIIAIRLAWLLLNLAFPFADVMFHYYCYNGYSPSGGCICLTKETTDADDFRMLQEFLTASNDNLHLPDILGAILKRQRHYCVWQSCRWTTAIKREKRNRQKICLPVVLLSSSSDWDRILISIVLCVA